MTLKEQQNLFARYLQGKTTSEENRKVELWYDLFDQATLNKNVDVNDATGEELLKQIKTKVRKKKHYHLQVTVYKIAAVMLLALSIVLYFFMPASTILVTGLEKKRFLLPDSSVIWLNKNSKISYITSTFNHKTRKLRLEEGEAFFDVAPDKWKPFEVQVDGIKVIVLGTAFNINKADQTQSIEVTVSHGKVQVNLENDSITSLVHGEQFTYNDAQKTYSVNLVSPDLKIEWREEKLTLDDADFDEMASAFSRLYQINITTQSGKIRKHRYSLDLSTEFTADQSLQIISAIHHIKYNRINEDTIELTE